MSISMKTKILPQLMIYVIWCLSLYAVFISNVETSWQNISGYFEQLSAEKGLFAVMCPLLIFVLTGMISDKDKARLVFRRWRDALPGNRVFSELGPDDERINMDRIKEIVGTIPTDPHEQNALWYRYFKKYQNNEMLQESHKQFMLAREMTAVTVVMFLLLPLTIYIINRSFQDAAIYGAILFAQYLGVSLAGKNHGRRFACDVLAEMCTS